MPSPCFKRRGSVISSRSLMSQARWPPRDLSGAVQSILKGTEPCSEERRKASGAVISKGDTSSSAELIGVRGSSLRAHHNPDHQPPNPPAPTSLGSQLPGQPPPPPLCLQSPYSSPPTKREWVPHPQAHSPLVCSLPHRLTTIQLYVPSWGAGELRVGGWLGRGGPFVRPPANASR